MGRAQPTGRSPSPPRRTRRTRHSVTPSSRPMAAPLPPFVPLDGRFGAVTTLLPSHHAARDFVEAAEASPAVLREAINAGRGLLLVRGLAGVVEEPELLVRLTRLFGAAESYRDEGRSAPAYLSDECHQIAVVSNAPPANRDGKRSSSLRVFFRSLKEAAALVPDKPEPELTPAGTIPTQYPHRRGWHTVRQCSRAAWLGALANDRALPAGRQLPPPAARLLPFLRSAASSARPRS